MSIIHATDGKTPLPWFPFVFLGYPYKLGGKVLIESFTCLLILRLIAGIGFEVCSEFGIFLCLLCNNCLNISSSLCIPCDHLLLWKVNLKADNDWKFLMHWKLEQSP